MRYIDADKLISFIDCGHLRPPTELAFSDLDVTEMIKKQPTAGVRENVRGEWQKVDEQPYFRQHFHKVCCSVCRKQGYDYWNFCPNCGAEMRGDNNGKRNDS